MTDIIVAQSFSLQELCVTIVYKHKNLLQSEGDRDACNQKTETGTRAASEAWIAVVKVKR